MASTVVQVSMLVEDAEVLQTEADRQMVIAVRNRKKAIARGEKPRRLKAIVASTVAGQIIRVALPEVIERK